MNQFGGLKKHVLTRNVFLNNSLPVLISKNCRFYLVDSNSNYCQPFSNFCHISNVFCMD